MPFPFLLQNAHVPIPCWLKVIYYFCMDAQLYQIQKYVPEVSKKTLIRMTGSLRTACHNEMQKLKESMVLGGEVECISNVEIVESVFPKKARITEGNDIASSGCLALRNEAQIKCFWR